MNLDQHIARQVAAAKPVDHSANCNAGKHVRVVDGGPGGAMISRCMHCAVNLQSANGDKPVGLETREVGTFKADPDAKPHVEQRFAGLQELVLGADADSRNFEGYGCVFGVVDSYDTVFENGCFAASLSKWRSERAWPSFYLQHDWDLIVGGYNDMFEDNKGLFVRGDFLESAWGEHARQLIKAKRARGLSIGFIALEWRIEERDGRFVRFVTKADLYEVSLVERPAVPGSGVTAIRADMTVREVEKALIETLGMSRDAAKAMASQWKPKGESRDEATQQAERAALDAQEREARAGAVNRELMDLLDKTRSSLQR